MRQIKFRARNAYERLGWLYGHFDVIDGQNKIINKDGAYLVIAGTECQYTGLKDKNGVEIYEGDKLSSGAIREYEFVVFYTNGMFGYKGFGDLFVPLKDHIRHFEVIGNSYEDKK